MENYVPPIWSQNILDEEELSPEERARLPWNIEEAGREAMRDYEEEKPDINWMYIYNEESDYY